MIEEKRFGGRGAKGAPNNRAHIMETLLQMNAALKWARNDWRLDVESE